MPVLDGIRGIAILLVMLIHFADRTAVAGGPVSRGFLQLTGAGWIGVDLFFVLSGFLITAGLLRAKTSPHYFRNFYARRTLRIFPLYYACLFVWLVAFPLIYSPHSTYVRQSLARLSQDQLWYWTYLSNWKMGLDGEWAPLGASVYWSLAIEEQFYLVWPGVVLLCDTHRLFQVCAALIAAAFVSRVALVMAGADPILIYVSTPTRMDALAIGAFVAATASNGMPSRIRLERLARWALPASMCGLGVIWVVIGSFSEYHPLMQTVGFTALSVMFGSFLVVATSLPDGHRFVTALSSRVLRFLGKHSYAIYLVHLTVAMMVVTSDRLRPLVGQRDLLLQTTKLVLSLVISLSAAWLSWHLFEKHFLALKRYFSTADAQLEPVAK